MTCPHEDARWGRRVWTMLEIMRQFSAVGLIDLFAQAAIGVYFETHPISRLMASFIGLSRFGRGGPVPCNAKFVTEQDRAELESQFLTWERECIEMGLPATAAILRRMLRTLDEEKCRYEDIWKHGRELGSRLGDELEGRFFLSLALQLRPDVPI